MLTRMRDLLQAKFCYHLFITPLPWPLEKEYRDFAFRACDFMTKKRSDMITVKTPRHHVIHHFSQPDNPNAPKVLITHGWMSRAAYMVRLIRALHREGYDVYALDFPAHGEAKGWQLPWFDAVQVLRETINKIGPFYAVIGHSFGGSMLLNTLNLSKQFPAWGLDHDPERVVMIASPVRMRVPVSKLARRLGLSKNGMLQLRDNFRSGDHPNIHHLNYQHFVKNNKTPVLCIHGNDDESIDPMESIIFCRRYAYASLTLLPGVDHVGVLIDERVERNVLDFLQ